MLPLSLLHAYVIQLSMDNVLACVRSAARAHLLQRHVDELARMMRNRLQQCRPAYRARAHR